MSVNAQALWEEGQQHIVAGRYVAARAAWTVFAKNARDDASCKLPGAMISAENA